MRDNTYRIILGAMLLLALYLDLKMVIYGVIVVTLLEGITNWRIPKLVNQVRNIPEIKLNIDTGPRFNFEAERLFRLTVSTFLLLSYYLGAESIVWFFPWFIGFATLGAGVSGLCPAILLLKWLGFR